MCNRGETMTRVTKKKKKEENGNTLGLILFSRRFSSLHKGGDIYEDGIGCRGKAGQRRLAA